MLRNKKAEILARVACDQAIFAPTFIGIFLSSMAVLERSDPREKLRHAYFPALGANYLVWPAVQVVNFRFIPLQHRLMFVNVVAIGWNCYLSWLNGRKVSVDRHHDDDVADAVREVEEKVERIGGGGIEESVGGGEGKA